MVCVINKNDCCGCNACAQKCPKQCITMQPDEEGFFYPIVNMDKCINCHLCEKVCPCINQTGEKEPLACYAAKNKDEIIRKSSSSGGVFTLLAEIVIDERGVVFGVRFDDNWDAVHYCAETVDDLKYFRGSKYVQSKTGDTFKRAEGLLKKGRKVLFSGTPCQISGFKHYLQKEYDNLLLVEVACHGVSSPLIWSQYLHSLGLSNIGSITHKDKTTGWRGYSLTIKDKNSKVLFTEKASENKFLLAFGRNLILRPSCHSCLAKSGKSGADITLADFWGIEHVEQNLNDDVGTNLICINTDKGLDILRKTSVVKKIVDYHNSIQYNPALFRSTNRPEERDLFWQSYSKKGIQALDDIKSNNQTGIKSWAKRILKILK